MGLAWSHARFPFYQARVSEPSVAQASHFCGYHHYDLDPSAHIISPISPGLAPINLAQCSIVDLCICFNQLLDEGSMMTIEVVINLITGEGQLDIVSALLRVLTGVILVDS